MHDLPAFVLHLHFFAGVAFIGLATDLRNQVESDLVREDLGLVGFTLSQCIHLVLQLHRTFCTCTGNGLISRGGHGADGGDGVQGIDSSQGDDGGAVGVTDNAIVPSYILGVNLGNDQRHLGIHTESRGVIHKHSACGLDSGSKTLSDIVLGSAQDDVHALKSGVASFLNGDFLALEHQSLAGTAAACQRDQLAHGEVALLQNLDHFLTYGAGSTENSNGIGLHKKLLTLQNYYRAPGWLPGSPGCQHRR